MKESVLFFALDQADAADRLRRRWALALCLAAMAAAGAAAVVLGTRWGTGVSNDSIYYLAGARNLAAGRGFSSDGARGKVDPITHWGPGLPAVLAALAALGADPWAADRGVNAMAMAANVALVGAIVWRGTRGSILPAVAAAGLALTGADFVHAHLRLWSEPPFLTAMLLALWAVAEDIETPRWPVLIGGGLAAGLAYLVRYAGVSIVLTGCLALLLFTRSGGGWRGWVEAAKRAVIFGAAAAAVIGPWVVRNAVVAHEAVGREIGWGGVPAEKWAELRDTAAGWVWREPVADDPAARWLAGAVALAATVLWTLYRRRVPAPPVASYGLNRGPATAGVFLLFAAVYLPFLILSVVAFDPAVPFTGRMLLPAAVCLIVAGACYAAQFDRLPTFARVPCGIALTAAVTGLLVLNGITAGAEVSAARERGLGYASPSWVGSPILDAVRALPDGARIYTNGPDAVRFFAGQRAVLSPQREGNSADVPTQIDRMVASLRESDGVLVWFGRITHRTYLVPEEELLKRVAARAKLVQVYRGRDGSIWRVAEGEK